LLANLEYRLGLARLTYARNGESYIKGQIDYIRVLESLQSLQALERNVVTAQRTLVERRIDLYRSIAGPCDPPQPAPAQNSVLQETTRTDSGSLIQDKQVSL